MAIQLNRPTPVAAQVVTEDLLRTVLELHVRIAERLDASVSNLSAFLTTPVAPPDLGHYAAERGCVAWDIAMLAGEPGILPHLAPHLGMQTLTLADGTETTCYAFLGNTPNYDALPVYLVAYIGVDDLLHFYVPGNGNAINPLTHTIFLGSADDLAAARHIGYQSLDQLNADMHDPAVACRIYDIDRLHADMCHDLSS